MLHASEVASPEGEPVSHVWEWPSSKDKFDEIYPIVVSVPDERLGGPEHVERRELFEWMGMLLRDTEFAYDQLRALPTSKLIALAKEVNHLQGNNAIPAAITIQAILKMHECIMADQRQQNAAPGSGDPGAEVGVSVDTPVMSEAG